MQFLLKTLALHLSAQLSLMAGEIHNGGNFLTEVISHDNSPTSEDYLGLDLGKGWFEPVSKHDHSAGCRSVRYIHPLTLEAAFNEGDLFVDYIFNSFDDVDEHEIKIELEVALTRRLGIILETAYQFENEDDSTQEGFTDFGFALRSLLIEFDSFLATASLGFEIPTGSNAFTSDELVIEPSLLNWFDLGHGFSLNTSVGFGIGTESQESDFFFDAALIKDVPGPFAISLELRNEVGLRDEERGEVSSEGTLGAIFRLNGSTAVRGGWNFPISNDEFRGGAIASFNFSF